MRGKHPLVRISDADGTILRDLKLLAIRLDKPMAELLRNAVEQQYEGELAHVREQSTSFFAEDGKQTIHNGTHE